METGPDDLEDLTSVEDELLDVQDLAFAASLSGDTIDHIARMVLESGECEQYSLSKVMENAKDVPGGWQVDLPFDPPEVWAAGVTYKNSELERKRESGTPDVYSMVYSAERPELFFKATPERCVGPFDSVGIRSDSSWNVPEPELAFVIYGEEIIGYTIGNDMTSRSIEGENPLYLPQAKIFDQCCSIGPCFATPDTFENPHDLSVSCVIHRDNEVVFEGVSSTSQMARRCDELAIWLQKHNWVPSMTTVLTGTSIVPPPEFSLKQGDDILVTIEGIGTLHNTVVEV